MYLYVYSNRIRQKDIFEVEAIDNKNTSRVIVQDISKTFDKVNAQDTLKPFDNVIAQDTLKVFERVIPRYLCHTGDCQLWYLWESPLSYQILPVTQVYEGPRYRRMSSTRLSFSSLFILIYANYQIFSKYIYADDTAVYGCTYKYLNDQCLADNLSNDINSHSSMGKRPNTKLLTVHRP